MRAPWKIRDARRTPRPVRGRLAIALEKALDVRRPLRDVFAHCSQIERLPELLPHVREAKAIAGDHHHWVLDGVEGPPLEWDTVVTRFGSNRVIAWETVAGSVLRHAGQLTFRPNLDGSTRVTLSLSYVLPPGAFGDRVATLVTNAALEAALREWRARLESLPRAS